MTEAIPLGIIGRILQGNERGRFVEVVDDGPNTGGFLIFTYSDADRSPEVFDAWVETLDAVETYFRESGWSVEWTSARSRCSRSLLVDHSDSHAILPQWQTNLQADASSSSGGASATRLPTTSTGA